MTDEEQAAQVVTQLQNDFPALEIGTGFISSQEQRVWFARGRDGHPWFVMSGDLLKFEDMLRSA